MGLNRWLNFAFMTSQFANLVISHGFVISVTIGGQKIRTYEMWEGYDNTKPDEIGWSVRDNAVEGYISEPSSPDVICHQGARNAPSHAKIAAGEQLKLNWNHYPHEGPLVTYMANCNGPCEKVDKNTLKFFKIDESGLLDWQPGTTGSWATGVLLKNGYTWTVNIPKDIAPGSYVLRHEAIALHIFKEPQFYPNCLNLEVSGTGSSQPQGVAGTQLYKLSDPGLMVQIHDRMTSYDIPGPQLYAGASPADQSPFPATGPLANNTIPRTQYTESSPTNTSTTTGQNGSQATQKSSYVIPNNNETDGCPSEANQSPVPSPYRKCGQAKPYSKYWKWCREHAS